MKNSTQKPNTFTSPEEIAKNLCCSETMTLSLCQYLKYRSLIGTKMPENCRAKDRKEGKEILERIGQETRALPVPFSASHPEKPFPFVRILMEERLRQNKRANAIREAFPDLPVSAISHYKDVLNRTAGDSQDGKALILAEKKGMLLYPGAPVCQDFGNRHFYYASNVMNCIFDCEYCYLKGMYPASHMVVFVNTEDYFRETEELLKKHPVYLCISYDTDLPAVEKWTGLLSEWLAFASGREDLTLEIRTKFADSSFFEQHEPLDNTIFAFTLSPDAVSRTFEHFTPPLSARLSAVKAAMEKGFQVRLCFDPMLFCEDWKTLYGEMVSLIADEINLSEIRDCSIGTFRISSEYLRSMRKKCPNSAVVQYPYVNARGVYGYEKKLSEEMTSYLMLKIHKYISEEKIFLWK